MVSASPDNRHRVLIVDSEPDGQRRLGKLLSRPTWTVAHVSGVQAALAAVRAREADVLVAREYLPDGSGLSLVGQVTSLDPDRPVILISEHAEAQYGLKAIQAGAYQCVPRPRMSERLVRTVAHALDSIEALADARRPTPSGRFERVFDEFVTQAPEMKPVMRALENAFTSSVPVLIHGESGTGKELAARAIHNQGPRKDFPFIAMNCAGIPEALLEAELFGHERGAFTGAVSRRLGVFEQAQGGTLFLDEIGDLHPSLQAKLLRVLQSKQFKRVGGNSTLTADVRVLAATNRDLEQEVEEGRFRPDLYYRLAVYTVLLPPLRDRAGDVPYLVVYFLTRCADRENKEIVGADPEVLELLELHDYPGNVRELENIISYAVVSARDEVLSIADLPPGFLRAVARKQKLVDADRGTATPADEDTGEGPFATLAAHEKKHIANALLRARGNKTRAAHMLGVSRMRLYRKIAEYGLEDSQEDPAQPAESEDA